MAKTIKRVGIIFFVLVVSLLVAVGSVFAVNVTVGDDFYKDSINISADNSQNNTYTSNNSISNFTIPSADMEFELKHNDSCTDETTCTCLQDIWSEAVQQSFDKSIKVKVTLKTDWIAREDAEYVTSFGDGFGFSAGRLSLVQGTDIILDLNGHEINRALTVGTDNGQVIGLVGTLSICDSKFDGAAINALYNEFMPNIENENAQELFLQRLNGLRLGKICNANNNGDGGAILAITGSILNIYSGVISDSHSGLGGAIRMRQDSVLNFYDGLIYNCTANNGGGIFTQAETYILGGYLFCNVSHGNGGAIYSSSNNLHISSGNLSFNDTVSDGGAIFLQKVNMTLSGGILSANQSIYGGGIVMYDSELNMYDGEIVYNKVSGNSGGICVWSNSTVTMYGGKVSHNVSNRTAPNTDRGGGGMMVGNGSTINMYDGEVCYNKVINSQSNIDIYGGGILVTNNSLRYSELNLYGGKICGNSLSNTLNKAYGGGIGIVNDKSYANYRINIYGAIIVEDNTANNRASDLYLKNDEKIYMNNFTQYGMCNIGIDLPDDYGNDGFTLGYKTFYNLFLPNRLFFSNVQNKKITELANGEVALVDGVETQRSEITWKWGDGQNQQTSTEKRINVEYTGSPYKITNSIGEMNGHGNTEVFSEYLATEIGTYTFYVQATYKIPVFSLVITPKKVDVLWKNTDLTYNGGIQKPTAYIAEDPNCKVTVNGGQVHSGSGYMATATALSNSNYVIRNNISTMLYNIKRAKVNRPFGNDIFEFDGNEKVYLPNGFDMDIMDISDNNATEIGSYEATISLKDKYNYEWADGGNEDIKLPYAITLAPVVEEDNSVYKFIYLDTEDNTRKTYTEGDLKHGLNDSNVNIKDGSAHYVLGNILPETSVKEFVQTLNYDTAKLKVFNNKGVEVSLTDEVTVIGSGWYIEYTPVVGGAKDTIYLSVLGDVTGDGRIDATDITYLRRIANGEIDKATLNPAVLLAAMVDNRGKITSVDAEILRAICKYETTIEKYI